ncbi:hypothetical protein G6F22_020661 [Rhizopus arrhizus]|nr:hypothetical protein G6F22_020661 [Rhizopus arrhizus]
MGDVGQALDAGNAVSALALARQWAHLFPGSYYIELQRAGMDGDEAYTQAAMRLAGEAGLPVVATHPVQFLDEYEFQAHEARFRGNGAAFRRRALGAGQHGRNRQALQPEPGAGQAALPGHDGRA